MIKGYRIRLYPTKEQEELLWEHIRASRFIWNYILGMQRERFEAGQPLMSGVDTIKLITPLKKEDKYVWLNEVSNTSLQQTLRALDIAYTKFYKHKAEAPNFKSEKKSKQSYPVCAECMYFTESSVQIQKVGKIRYKTDKEIPIKRKGEPYYCKFIAPHISYVNRKWYISFSIDISNNTKNIPNTKQGRISMGIDIGIKEFATVSYGNEVFVYHNINKSKRMRDLDSQLKFHQRRVSHKYTCAKERTGDYTKSNNIKREEDIVRRIYQKMSGIRLNYIHQITHELISLNPSRIVIEDISVLEMTKDLSTKKAVREQNFYEFKRQLEYKCAWNDIELVVADKYFPSSKMCSCCGKINKNLKLSDRIYTCECGNVIDRDLNAAINLMRYEA